MSDEMNQLHQSLSLMSIDDDSSNNIHKQFNHNNSLKGFTNAKTGSSFSNLSRQSLDSHDFESPQFAEKVSPNRQDSFSDEDEQFVEHAYPVQKETPKKQHIEDPSHQHLNNLIPVVITWDQGGNSVFVTGSFTDWRKMIALEPVDSTGRFAISLKLPVGNHRFRFIVDGELRISDSLPQATDQMGNFVNFLEVVSPSNSPTSHSATSSNKINSANLQSTSTGTLKTAQDTNSPNISSNRQNSFSNKNKLFPGMTSIEKEEEDSKRREEDQSHMSKSSRIALQIARENDTEPINMGNGYERVPAANKGPILLIKSESNVASPNSNASSPSSNNNKSTKQLEYTYEIPAVFTDPQVMEQYYLTLDQQRNNQQYMTWLTPPQLPPHLEKVILNTHNKHSHNTDNQDAQPNEDLLKEKEKENTTGALPIPNHVVLNHLITSSIKHNTLCVASTVRYKKKYVTQVLYAPL